MTGFIVILPVASVLKKIKNILERIVVLVKKGFTWHNYPAFRSEIRREWEVRFVH